jgi:hypothetical protein
VLAVVVHGVGDVGKNIAVNTLTFKQVKNCPQEKIITMRIVVAKKKASKRRTIAQAVTQGIVVNGGRVLKRNHISIYNVYYSYTSSP